MAPEVRMAHPDALQDRIEAVAMWRQARFTNKERQSAAQDSRERRHELAFLIGGEPGRALASSLPRERAVTGDGFRCEDLFKADDLRVVRTG
jgi:hypothetical protein